MAGRTAVLTGVTGGWGRAVLDRFLAQGWDVCATTRSGGVEVPSQVLVVEADLTDTAAAEHVVAAALERFGSVDALGCVAGGFRASRAAARVIARRLAGDAVGQPRHRLHHDPGRADPDAGRRHRLDRLRRLPRGHPAVRRAPRPTSSPRAPCWR